MILNMFMIWLSIMGFLLLCGLLILSLVHASMHANYVHRNRLWGRGGSRSADDITTKHVVCDASTSGDVDCPGD